MRKLLFFCLAFTASSAFAQTDEPVLINVLYTTIHVNDTNHRDRPLTEDMLLQVGQNSSRYARPRLKRPAPSPATADAGTPVVVGKPMALVYGPGITQEEYFQHPAEGKLNIASSLGRQDYLMQFALPKISWIISAETRRLGGYTCQKAEGEFGGRRYTAWFTSELPFSVGPWKLSGLPGLILEAEDSKKEVQFLLKEINRDTTGALTQSARERLVTVSEPAFERARKAFYVDPAAGMQAQLPPGAPTVQLAYRDASGKVTFGEDARRLIDKKNREEATINNNPMEWKKD